MKLAGAGLVFAPSIEEMYPPGFQTWVEVTELGSLLEEFRPATSGGSRQSSSSCSRSSARRGCTSGRRTQQVEVIRRLVAGLALEVEVRALPTVRDEDGLAASLANVLLSPEERASAGTPARAGDETAESARDGSRAVERPRRRLRRGRRLRSTILAGAVRVGSTRLIDSVVLEGETER